MPTDVAPGAAPPPRAPPLRASFDRRVELLYILGAFLLYQVSQFWHIGDPYANARALWQMEAFLHVDWERATQAWVVDRPALSAVFAWYYLPMHILPFVALFLYLFLRRHPGYVPFRSAALASIVPGFLLFILVPMAPPRFLPEVGVRDLVDAHNAIGHTTGWVQASANQTGAFPSEHLIWAVLVAWGLARLVDRRWWIPGLLHVAVTAVSVVATGHHFVLDVVAGLLLGLLAVFLVERHLGARPPRPLAVPSLRPAPPDVPPQPSPPIR